MFLPNESIFPNELLLDASIGAQCSTSAYLAAFHSVWQTLQLPVGYWHVVLAHGTVLETPAFPIVIDKLSCFAWKKQGLLIILQWGKISGEWMDEWIQHKHHTRMLGIDYLYIFYIVAVSDFDIWAHSPHAISSQTHYTRPCWVSEGLNSTNLQCQGEYKGLYLDWPAVFGLSSHSLHATCRCWRFLNYCSRMTSDSRTVRSPKFYTHFNGYETS